MKKSTKKVEEINIFEGKEEFFEALMKVKNFCKDIDCSECPLSVGIYQEGPAFTYYSCDIRKKPRDWDLEKERMKQDKNYKKDLAKKEKEKEEEKEDKPKKKRGRKKKSDK